MDNIRLQKYLSSAGIASRRAAEKLIVAGEVYVNGRKVTTLGTKVGPIDKITVKGSLVKPIANKVYYIFHKPNDVITTVKDPKNRKKVMDFFMDKEAGLHPVGRLDRNTTGLLLITNDGELTNKLIHPRYKINKKYYLELQGDYNENNLNIIRKGVELPDGKTAPAQLSSIEEKRPGIYSLYVTIHEGKNRQIRRMFEKVGLEVVKLRRVKFGPLVLRSLAPGKSRKLTQKEIKELKNYCLEGRNVRR